MFYLMLSKEHPFVKHNFSDAFNDDINILLNNFLFGLELLILLKHRITCLLLSMVKFHLQCF